MGDSEENDEDQTADNMGRMKPTAVLRLPLLDYVTEAQGSMGSLAETPFDYTSSDEEGRFRSLSNNDSPDRTKKLSVRISDVVDVNMYRSSPPSGDSSSIDEGDEDLSSSIDDIRPERDQEFPESHYDVPASSAREERLSESDSVFSKDSITPEITTTIDGKTFEDCVAMMDDGTFSVASNASDDEGFAKRSKSFLNLFFGVGNERGERGPGQKHKKIGHRRVDSNTGAVSYKKIPASGLMEALQIGIGHSIGSITPQEARDILMKDFSELEIVHFPALGTSTTPAHRCKDFIFKTYAARAFKKFRKEFSIEADDFLVSLCTHRLKELSNPGASGSLFFLSHDDNFIIKTITRKEAIFLQKLLPGYYLNLTQNKKTTLPCFYGSFQYESMGKTIRICIMNNILPSNIKYHEKYDLKGSMFKRQANHKERTKASPTLKDLDFLEEHPGGLILEPDLYDDLKRTLERDIRVLESFRIMDYSLLLGIHNISLNKQETLKSRKPNLETRPYSDQEIGYDQDYAKQVLDRIGSKRLKDNWKQDDSIPHGGTLAVNERGEQCLIFLGIIDILQSYRLLKKMEHSWKSIITDGDTVSVHRPGFYAERFKNFCFDRVFKRGDDSSPQVRRQKSGIRRQTSRTGNSNMVNNPVPRAKPKETVSAEPSPVIEPTDDAPGPSKEPDEQPAPSVIKSSQPASSEPADAVELESVSISLDKSKEENNHTAELRTVLVSPV
ncbi:phosphatidylinositol 4-phosphate 5-kinase type-1 alpha-like isoform X3 [Bolinopsis microptera]|uniref:phosphatidylinositol 4-phosphate 5-kinase type-1 alpha-like isoform X3 n=2 Tax=Bolinopsis microptera TaxID=2820187 RepID=UPI003078C0F1